jgi:glutaredoxin 3
MTRGHFGWAARPGAVLFTLLLAALAGGVACRKPKPEVPAAQLPPLEVDRAGKWLYTHADAAGRFVTVDDPQAIPSESRAVVRVTDPARAGERKDGVAVYVVDVNQLLAKGKVTAQVLSREGFETGALSQLPPGASSAFPPLVPGGPSVPPSPPGGQGGAAPPGQAPAAAPPANGQAVVILYGTSWCPACKSARQYLTERKIPFADKDIERDASASRELREKAARLGVPADRIPILDVRGRLLIGFDKSRLEALLGEAS